MSAPTPSRHYTVALVDTRWGGHHPTYLREFTASLLRIGARAQVICRDPSGIIDSLPDGPYGDLSRHVHGHRLIHRNQGVINPHRDHDPASTLLRWKASGRAVAAAEQASGWRADLVFFCYLDSYLRFAPFPAIPSIFLGRPWSGLYFRNAHLADHDARVGSMLRRAAKGDRILRSAGCRAVCVLDERFNDTLRALSGHPVVSFPDMTDETVPACRSEAAQRIIQQAAGRRIIGLISMEKRKGLITLLRAALRAHQNNEPWFFVATGPFHQHSFSHQELQFCSDVAKRAASGEIDNLYFDTSGDRIPDGAPFNSIFTTFDLVWAAYEGFQGSSNALTKASAFHIPLLATAGECIGDRVEHHQLGRTFPEADVDACIEAIRAALAGTGPNGTPLQPRFDAYHHLHSRQRLDEVFGYFVTSAARSPIAHWMPAR